LPDELKYLETIYEETEEEVKFQSISRIQMQWKLEGMLKKLDRRLERLEEKLGTTPPHEKADKTQIK